jgi:hypothetical protein
MNSNLKDIKIFLQKIWPFFFGNKRKIKISKILFASKNVI